MADICNGMWPRAGIWRMKNWSVEFTWKAGKAVLLVFLWRSWETHAVLLDSVKSSAALASSSSRKQACSRSHLPLDGPRAGCWDGDPEVLMGSRSAPDGPLSSLWPRCVLNGEAGTAVLEPDGLGGGSAI